MLFADEFFVICHRNHFLAQRQSVDVAESGIAPRLFGFSQGSDTDQLMAPNSFNYVLEVRQLTTMIRLVGRSQLWGEHCDRFDTIPVSAQGYRDCAVSNLSLQRRIYLVTDKEQQLSQCTKEFYEFLLEKRRVSLSAQCTNYWFKNDPQAIGWKINASGFLRPIIFFILLSVIVSERRQFRLILDKAFMVEGLNSFMLIITIPTRIIRITH